MSLAGKLRDALRRGDTRVDADALIRRVGAVDRFAEAGGPHLPADDLRPARVVVERAGGRLALSRDHTVVALAGATGSGKSSLFNAVSAMDLSVVGVLRPTTGVPHACVWQAAGAGGLLDWLAVPADRRFERESALDADDEVGLRGLVLLDLPDFDSVQVAHRVQVDRLLQLVDLVVWVTDPQKYADQVIHERYLRLFHRYAQSMVVVLNQADRLSDADLGRCLADLRGLLTADGLGSVPLFPVSAIPGTRPGVAELRATLERTVADRMAALRRLGADVEEAVEALTPLVGPAAAEDRVDRAATEELTRALAISAGVPAVAEAAASAYKLRAGRSTGWPLTRWIRHRGADPLHRVRLGRADAATERSTAALAVRAIGDSAGTGLPAPWSAVLLAAARSRGADLPDALDRAVVGTDLGVERKPFWWRLVGLSQWLVMLAAVVGALWLLLRLALIALGVPTYDLIKVGRVPLATVLLVGGVLAGVLIALLVKPLIAAGARRARRRADARLRSAIGEIAQEYVAAPVRSVLHDYAEARDALTVAGR